MDGEAVGDFLHVFDLLEIDSCDIRAISYRDRLVRLLNLLATGQQTGIQWVATITGPSAKKMVYRQLRKDGAEGVVFKRIGAPYSPGGARRQSYRGSCGFLVSGEPEVVKSVAQQESSEVQDVLRPLDGPEHARVFEPLSDDGFAACLDDAGADKEAL